MSLALNHLGFGGQPTNRKDRYYDYAGDTLTNLYGKGKYGKLTQLTSFTFPAGITTIAASTADQYTNLITTMDLSDVEVINESAFAYSPLTDITIGAGVLIAPAADTMGTNTGFRTYYVNSGAAAGKYKYTESWSKL